MPEMKRSSSKGKATPSGSLNSGGKWVQQIATSAVATSGGVEKML